MPGTAYGWGGNPDKDATYVNVVPEKNDGKTPYTLTVPADVPASGFWSIIIYNARSNYLPITPGWNYIARLYRPDFEVLNGSWSLPAAVPVE